MTLLPPSESAKQRAFRIPLDFVRPSRFQRAKLAATIAAAAIAALYAAWIAIGPQAARSQLSPGSVASAHAPWENQCETCHNSFSPLRADSENSAMKQLSAIFAQDQLAASQAAEVKCQTCHTARVHHETDFTPNVERCTSCHVDHQGRSATMTHPSDQHCTRCHAGLAKQVHAFKKDGQAVGHPPFTPLLNDPGNIRFNHQLHMTKGIRAADAQDEGLALVTVADLLENVTPAIATQLHRPGGSPIVGKLDERAPVELDCSSCHQQDLATGFPGESAQPTTLDGAPMLPVRYAQHCQACHPLYYENSHSKQLKHGLSVAEIRQALAGEFWSNSLSARDSTATPEPTGPRIPGRDNESRLHAAEQERISKSVQQAEQYLLEKKICLKCHYYNQPAPLQQKLAEVLQPDIPTVWLKKASFNHRTHLAFPSLECRTCHSAAYASSSSATTKKPDEEIVMIDGQDVCLNCHAPRPRAQNAIAARFDCVECHRYHVTKPTTNLH